MNPTIEALLERARVSDCHLARCLEDPDYFTTFRFGGRGKRDRREFPTIDAALEDAKGDPRAGVYVVAKSGNSAHIQNGA